MRTLLLGIAGIGLALTLLPSLLLWGGAITQDEVKSLMALGLAFWFIGVLPLGRRQHPDSSTSREKQ